MDSDLFQAILSMDSYNRGYSQGFRLNPEDGDPGQHDIGRQLGKATIIAQSDINPQNDAVKGGFYAVAYNLNGGTVISYGAYISA